MRVTVDLHQETDYDSWDKYVIQHPRGTLYHLASWKNIIEKTYGHNAYYLSAIESSDSKQSTIPGAPRHSANSIKGILPLVHIKHFLLDNSLISMPFFDLGGILADDEQTEKLLFATAIELGRRLKARSIELRHIDPVKLIAKPDEERREVPTDPDGSLMQVTRSHKVRMLLALPGNSNELMGSFKSKLRSQIRKPLKEGLISKFGGPELLADFYEVFSCNMRDLGSPVHSKSLMLNVLNEFPDQSKIIVVYKNSKPLACSLVVGFRDTLENPWASSLRKYARLSPNMLLYWSMLEYACDNQFEYFDFGRSSPNEATYKFKEQWGAEGTTLHWQYAFLRGKPSDGNTPEKSGFQKAVYCWQKLPVPVTKIIGPRIRKYIGL